MGNWYVDLRRSGLTLRLVKDRLQYMILDPPTEELKVAGLFRAFNSMEEFRRAVISWISNSNVYG